MTRRAAAAGAPGRIARRQDTRSVVVGGATHFQTIAWAALTDGDPRWQARRCLYAYLVPDLREVLYIGLAWGCSVRARWVRSGKNGFWTDLEGKRGIRGHAALVGEILPGRGSRLTRKVAADLEAVLIAAMHPWGNVQIPGISAKRLLCVRNCGSWPGPARIQTRAA